MAYQLDPAISLERELRRTAHECLHRALEAVDRISGGSPDEVEEAVHSIRKRCKEARGLARLVRPALDKEFRRFNRNVRRAAAELSSIRDAHVVLATFDDITTMQPHEDPGFDQVRGGLAIPAERATETIARGGESIRQTRRLLKKATTCLDRWEIPDGFDPVAAGLALTYERGRQGFDNARSGPTAESLHEWRKAVKNLWYQSRLLEVAAPSVMSPLIPVLDELSDALGSDHDLAVLIASLAQGSVVSATRPQVELVVTLAAAPQNELQTRAFLLGETVYRETTADFVERVRRDWNTTH